MRLMVKPNLGTRNLGESHQKYVRFNVIDISFILWFAQDNFNSNNKNIPKHVSVLAHIQDLILSK